MPAPNTYLGTIEVAQRACAGTCTSVTGAVNALGYSLCMECAEPHDLYLTAILSDNSAFHNVECDMCGATITTR